MASKYQVEIHGWVFMTNHVLLVLTPRTNRGVSSLMQYFGRLYVRKFNYTYARTGSLFEDRLKSSLVQDNRYLLTCLGYIELNPVRAGMTKDPGDYKWSSYRVHAFGRQSNLCTPHLLNLELNPNDRSRQQAYRCVISEALDADVVSKIRHCTNKGLILGTQEFRQQFESLNGDIPTSPSTVTFYSGTLLRPHRSSSSPGYSAISVGQSGMTRRASSTRFTVRRICRIQGWPFMTAGSMVMRSNLAIVLIFMELRCVV